MIHILVVDDEKQIRELVQEYAEFTGYRVSEASDGMEAVQLCREQDFDILVMDVMMPRMDGFSACKEIRKIKNIPILMLSARGEEYDKLFGFEVGVDDYVVKPFSPKELMARVNAILSRSRIRQSVEPDEQWEFGGFRIDPPGRDVYLDGEKISLTAKEYDLLHYMALNRNIVLTREQILNAVWGYEFPGEDRTVDTQIKMLRNSLGAYRDMVVTIRGVGYKFEA